MITVGFCCDFGVSAPPVPRHQGVNGPVIRLCGCPSTGGVKNTRIPHLLCR